MTDERAIRILTRLTRADGATVPAWLLRVESTGGWIVSDDAPTESDIDEALRRR
jgi:hypothetical protein